MNLENLIVSNKNIPIDITKIYLLDLYDVLDNYIKGYKKLICLKYNYILIISDNMEYLNIEDTIENLTNIGKIMSYQTNVAPEISKDIDKDIYNYLDKLNKTDILDVCSSFSNKYIDPTHLNLCQYHHIYDYYILFEKMMPPKVFNFFNTLIPENERINDIIDIPNIIMYLSLMNLQEPTIIINYDVIKKVKDILKEKED